MPSSSWTFRPSAFTSESNVYTETYSRGLLEDCYDEDNQRASDEGVKILPRPGSSKLRTLQWNINSAWGQNGIVDTIRDADAEVVVLNEYTNDESFEKELIALGYSHVYCATPDYPTAIATRLKVMERKEIRLSYDRSAMLIQVQAKDDALVWVIGTHINFVDGSQRLKEMQVLTKELTEMGILGDTNAGKSAERVVLVGDLNQQREQDYSPDEWARIRAGMIRRESSQDDGVAKLLDDRGFVCAWDSSPPPEHNWETAHPPATHWSGTVVDYSYGINVTPSTVSISPAAWSDHRMTVCDWKW